MTSETCNKTVSWWDGEYEGTCELPIDHKGPHFDGISCFNDELSEVEIKSLPIPPIFLKISYRKDGKDISMNEHVLNQGNLIASFNPEYNVQILMEARRG